MKLKNKHNSKNKEHLTFAICKKDTRNKLILIPKKQYISWDTALDNKI